MAKSDIDYFIEGLKGPYLVCVRKGDGFDMSHNLDPEEAIVIIDYLMTAFEIEYEPMSGLN